MLLSSAAWILILPAALAVTCDEGSYPAETTNAWKLTPNTFHKICPSKSSLGEPVCGDGTPFAFYYTSPVKRRTSNKILIEFSGGGACWDADTCENNAKMLSFPYQLDDLLGLSCSEIQAGLNQNAYAYDENVPLNMLCAQQLGDVDFREYHTIVVPYCTQDVHMGSNKITYDDGTQVYHSGAVNMLSVLEWVYANFAHPEQIVLTGCSAGGTILPLAHDLVYHHYNSWTKKKGISFSTLLDSPVYLTPSYFMEQGLPNWNVEPLLDMVRFNYKKYGQSEEFSTKLFEHVLKRTSKTNTFGLITHTSDPVSLAYYQLMSAGNRDDDQRRRLDEVEEDEENAEDDEVADEEQWWDELSSSINSVTNKFSNADSFIIDGEGHCSFGLYYALEEGGSKFQEWAENQLTVSDNKRPSAHGWFWVSAMVGCTLVGFTAWHQKRAETVGDHINHEVLVKQQSSLQGSVFAMLHRMADFIASYTKDAPVTVAYGVAVTINFLRLMTWDHFENFFYNPSLGPTATTLSSFGINNPTLVVYKQQILRLLITSTFLCSGLITYVMVMYSLKNISKLEKVMGTMSQPNQEYSNAKALQLWFSSSYFLTLAAVISIGSNFLYAVLVSGASCSSMALVLGLQAFSSTMNQYHQQPRFPRPIVSTAGMFLVTAVLLPYNSWVMMITAILLGVALALWVYWFYVPLSVSGEADEDTRNSVSAYDDYTRTAESATDYKSYTEDGFTSAASSARYLPSVKSSGVTLLQRKRPLFALLGIFGILFFCLLLQIRKPNPMYEQPFLTSCNLMYTTHVDEIVKNYAGEDFAYQFQNGDDNEGEEEGEGRRQLEEAEGDDAKGDDTIEEERDEEHMCAQFCVPHLMSNPFLWGANFLTGFGVRPGFCEKVGYSQHIADKTFAYKSSSFDVELFFDAGYAK